MNNCLVTTLKSSVNNNNLPFINGVIVTVNKKDTTDGKITVQAVNNSLKIEVLGGASKIKCAELGYTDYTNQITVPTGQNYNIMLKNDAGYNISITDKADIKNFIIGGSNPDNAFLVDIDKFNCINSLIEIELSKTVASWNMNKWHLDNVNIISDLPDTIIGELSDYAKYPNLYYFIVKRNITGNMGEILDYIPNIETIILGEAYGISGTVEEFAEKRYSKGAKNTIILSTLPSHITFNGNSISGGPTWKIKKVDTNIVVTDNSDNQLGVYDGSTWTYNS